MRLAVDFRENLVQVPSPVRVCAHPADPPFPDLRGEQRAKSVPPEPHRFVADVDAALVQQVLNIAKRKGKAKVHHHCQANDLWAVVKVLEGVFFHHKQKLRNRPARLNPICADKTPWRTAPERGPFPKPSCQTDRLV
jgi:hypothetical protein